MNGVSRLGALLLVTGCRGWHDPVPFEECQPWALDCPECTFDQDRGEAPGEQLRVYRCATGTGSEVDAVRRPAVEVEGADTRFYDAESGARRAALREHQEPVEICGETVDEEWWGEVLDCEPVCEWEPALPEADPSLPACP